MAKLQIPIDDDLMKNAKMFALQHKTTLKDLVALALSQYIGQELPIITKEEPKKEEKQPTPQQPQEEEEETIMITLFERLPDGTKYYDTGKIAPNGNRLKVVFSKDTEGNPIEYFDDMPDDPNGWYRVYEQEPIPYTYKKSSKI